MRKLYLEYISTSSKFWVWQLHAHVISPHLLLLDLVLHSLQQKLGVDARLLEQVLQSHVSLVLFHLRQLSHLVHRVRGSFKLVLAEIKPIHNLLSSHQYLFQRAKKYHDRVTLYCINQI